MLSQTAEYAVRAVVFVAAAAGRPATTHQIAEATRVPADYLSKIMQALGRARLVRAQRGRNGGFTLARAAEAVSLLDVVNAVDPLRRIEICPLGLESHGARLCGLHRRLDDALGRLEEALASASIGELLGESGSPRPLCGVTEKAHA